ncbi:MAG: hypothetical protein FWG17_00905 [Desulfovibrionaceae bacterium]|nr:hypothetical protein [Desulfovibrionaceae bacterium]
MMEQFSLPGYSDGNLSFRGRMFAENIHADEESGCILRVRMFLTEDNRLVHSIVFSANQHKYSQTHILSRDGDLWLLDNGLERFTLSRDLLFILVKDASSKDDKDLNAALDSLMAVA